MQIRRFQVRRIIACILLPCYLVACTSWKTQDASPQQVLAEEQHDKVLVKLADGSKLVLEQPVVAGDTLTGSVDGEQRSIPLADVSALEVRKTDALLTTALVFGTIVGLLAIAAGLCAASDCTAGLR